jgi:hypothetical protein
MLFHLFIKFLYVLRLFIGVIKGAYNRVILVSFPKFILSLNSRLLSLSYQSLLIIIFIHVINNIIVSYILNLFSFLRFVSQFQLFIFIIKLLQRLIIYYIIIVSNRTLCLSNQFILSCLLYCRRVQVYNIIWFLILLF